MPRTKNKWQRERNEKVIALLIPVAKKLAAKRPVTIADIRDEAEKTGLLARHEDKGLASALGALPKRAGLIRVGLRESHRPNQHGRILRSWVSPDYYASSPYADA